MLLGVFVRRLHSFVPQKRGGRDPGDGEEAQYRRVEGAVNAHDAEHRPPVRVLEYGSDSGDGRDGGREKVRVERDLDGGGSSEPGRAQEGTCSSASPDDLADPSVAATATGLRCDGLPRPLPRSTRSWAGDGEPRRASGLRLGPRQREPQREMVAAAMDRAEREV